MPLNNPLVSHVHLPSGCPDCEMERLKQWARENGLLGSFAGPKATVDTLLRLVAGMQEHINSLNERIGELTAALERKDRQ